MKISLIMRASTTGYLLGAIPISRIFSRIYGTTKDLDSIEIPIHSSDESSKVTSTGAAAASMKTGPKIGCTIGLLDTLKVVLPTLAFRLLYPNEYYFLIAAIVGMVGHNLPVFHALKFLPAVIPDLKQYIKVGDQLISIYQQSWIQPQWARHVEDDGSIRINKKQELYL